jgi:hypothetical protein
MNVSFITVLCKFMLKVSFIFFLCVAFFSDAVSNSDYVVLNDEIISE